MAMAEGERAECAEPAQDEPPAEGALKRAEDLKTQANDYFKGELAPEGARGEARAGGRRARAEPWQRGAAAGRGPARPGHPAWGRPGWRSPGAAGCGGAGSEGTGDDTQEEHAATEEGATKCVWGEDGGGRRQGGLPQMWDLERCRLLGRPDESAASS